MARGGEKNKESRFLFPPLLPEPPQNQQLFFTMTREKSSKSLSLHLYWPMAVAASQLIKAFTTFGGCCRHHVEGPTSLFPTAVTVSDTA